MGCVSKYKHVSWVEARTGEIKVRSSCIDLVLKFAIDSTDSAGK